MYALYASVAEQKSAPFRVLMNASMGISSCFRNPFAGKAPLETISRTAQTEAAVVQEIARQVLPAICFG
jgi:hypothetical protein